jgi:hypothetical protein
MKRFRSNFDATTVIEMVKEQGIDPGDFLSDLREGTNQLGEHYSSLLDEWVDEWDIEAVKAWRAGDEQRLRMCDDKDDKDNEEVEK